MLGQESEHFVKALDFVVQRLQRFRPITTADEMSACVTKHARHVTNQFRGCPHAFVRTKRTKIFRSISQSLLSAVGKRGQEMVQQFSLGFHLTPTLCASART